MILLVVIWHLILSGPYLWSPSVWLAEDLPAPPATTSVYGGTGSVYCVPGAEPDRYRCTMLAQGLWRRVIIDGQVIAERQTAFLPVVRR